MAKSKKSKVNPAPVEPEIQEAKFQAADYLGRIVWYSLTASDVAIINQRRAPYATGDAPQGLQVHRGNPPMETGLYPMIATAINGDGSLNGQVFLDGNDTHWVTDVVEGTDPGTYGVD